MSSRALLSRSLGIGADWSVLRQVHGNEAIRVNTPGVAGEGDAIWTSTARLPIAVFTADCYGVVVGSPTAVGVAHSGWRGTKRNVVGALIEDMAGAGHPPDWAAIGPGIGECCFEVGPEVATEFEGHVSETSWNTTSVDLKGLLVEQLDGLGIWAVNTCTYSHPGWFSHRRDAASERLATLAWIP